jgi:hypothetical protein
MPNDDVLSMLRVLELQQKMLAEIGCQVVALTNLWQQMNPQDFERQGHFHMLHLDAKTHSASAQLGAHIQQQIDRLIRQRQSSGTEPVT